MKQQIQELVIHLENQMNSIVQVLVFQQKEKINTTHLRRKDLIFRIIPQDGVDLLKVFWFDGRRLQALQLASLEGNISSAQHGNLPGGDLHALATADSAGFMSAAQFVLLSLSPDAPPESPSEWDDEFLGDELDAKWLPYPSSEPDSYRVVTTILDLVAGYASAAFPFPDKWYLGIYQDAPYTRMEIVAKLKIYGGPTSEIQGAAGGGLAPIISGGIFLPSQLLVVYYDSSGFRIVVDPSFVGPGSFVAFDFQADLVSQQQWYWLRLQYVGGFYFYDFSYDGIIWQRFGYFTSYLSSIDTLPDAGNDGSIGVAVNNSVALGATTHLLVDYFRVNVTTPQATEQFLFNDPLDIFYDDNQSVLVVDDDTGLIPLEQNASL